MGLGTHILHQWMAFAWYWGAFAFSGKSKCSLWRPSMGLGTHILHQWMALALHLLFPEKANAVYGGCLLMTYFTHSWLTELPGV